MTRGALAKWWYRTVRAIGYRTGPATWLGLVFVIGLAANGNMLAADTTTGDKPEVPLINAMVQSAVDVVEQRFSSDATPVVEVELDAVAETAGNTDELVATPTVLGEAQSRNVEPLPTWDSWVSPERLMSNIRVVAVMAALSLAPALLLMTTCYVRLVVVLSLLRQALGSQQLPPNQVTTTLAMFLTLLVMWPVWTRVHEEAIVPYTDSSSGMSADQAWEAGVVPVREFMGAQIIHAGNQEDVRLFLDYLNLTGIRDVRDVPLQALLPAFLISELKVAFAIGFQIFLPFVIVDLVVSSVTMSMGWVMVPPTTISLPLKLMLFVLVDGWHLVVEMLLMSFQVGS